MFTQQYSQRGMCCSVCMRIPSLRVSLVNRKSSVLRGTAVGWGQSGTFSLMLLVMLLCGSPS